MFSFSLLESLDGHAIYHQNTWVIGRETSQGLTRGGRQKDGRSCDYQNFLHLKVTIFSYPWCSTVSASRIAQELLYYFYNYQTVKLPCSSESAAATSNFLLLACMMTFLEMMT